ncbi:MAG: RNA methyltransferase [Bacteroidetes bacterium]|jgi:TrmH family RNA methyltransferase|nr:RNA methyltransferase [Bacteroidota bacterium]
MFSKSTIKYIQSLQHKKFRDEYNVFVAEGPKLVTELLLSNDFSVKAVFALQSWVDGLDAAIVASMQPCLTIIKDFELEKIAHYTTANNVVAVFGKRKPVSSISCKNKTTLVLDDIQDPGNFGTIIRTADWFGIENIICSANTVDMYNPKVVQSTMASLGRVNVVYTDILQWLQENKGIKKFAATLNGKPLKEMSSTKECIIIIGNESKGISKDVIESADEKITIPKLGKAESLNAAVAAAIILYAVSN